MGIQRVPYLSLSFVRVHESLVSRKLVQRGRLVSDVVKKETERAAKRSMQVRGSREDLFLSAERRAEQTRRVCRSRPVARGETQCCIVALDGPLTQVSECIRTRDTRVYIPPCRFFLASFSSFPNESPTPLLLDSGLNKKSEWYWITISFRIEKKNHDCKKLSHLYIC